MSATAEATGRAPSRALLASFARDRIAFAVLALLALIDLVSGANAHLTRSVLDAGGLDDLGDVAERRLRLSAHSFAQKADTVLLWLTVVVVVVGVVQRRRVLSWFAASPPLRAGFLATVAAVAVATLANDSGALLLEVGTLYLVLMSGFAWTQAGLSVPAPEAVERDKPHARAK